MSAGPETSREEIAAVVLCALMEQVSYLHERLYDAHRKLLQINTLAVPGGTSDVLLGRLGEIERLSRGGAISARKGVHARLSATGKR